MRMLMRVSIPVEAGNRAIKDGSLPAIIKQFIDANKPEASYFYTMDGQRTASFIFDMKDTSQIPALGETFFMALNAGVTFTPVMNAADLAKGMESMAKK